MQEMHGLAATIGPTAIILIGIIFGILYNQRGVDRLDARIDRLESHMNSRFDKIQDDLSGFHRSLGQHDKAIEVLEKRAT